MCVRGHKQAENLLRTEAENNQIGNCYGKTCAKRGFGLILFVVLTYLLAQGEAEANKLYSRASGFSRNRIYVVGCDKKKY